MIKTKRDKEKFTPGDLPRTRDEKDDPLGMMAFWSLEGFRKLGKEAKTIQTLEAYLRKSFPSARALYENHPDSHWLLFWHILYPERFGLRRTASRSLGDMSFYLREGFTPTDKKVLQALLMSPHGRALLWKTSILREEKEWAQGSEAFHQVKEEHFSRSSESDPLFCERCGEMFFPARKGQKFCSSECRRTVHQVSGENRKEYFRAYRFFQRKMMDTTRAEAWMLTREKHGEALESLGLEGEDPPATWHGHTRETS